jgi:hypothetical protein
VDIAAVPQMRIVVQRHHQPHVDTSSTP